MRAIVSVVLFLACLAACAGPHESSARNGRPWSNDFRLKEWQKLEGWKEAVNRDGAQPQVQEFEGSGTMFVWSHALSGGPGWEYLRATYSYQNTTDARFDIVRVWIEVLDSQGKPVNRTEDILRHPLGYALTPGDTWSDQLKVDTLGVHKQAGWSWRVGCEPVRMKVLPPRRYGQGH